MIGAERALVDGERAPIVVERVGVLGTVELDLPERVVGLGQGELIGPQAATLQLERHLGVAQRLVVLALRAEQLRTPGVEEAAQRVAVHPLGDRLGDVGPAVRLLVAGVTGTLAWMRWMAALPPSSSSCPSSASASARWKARRAVGVVAM